jgi:hypothetical protein
VTSAAERRRIEREWALRQIERDEARKARAHERRELWKKAKLGIASPAELDLLTGPSRYGRV